MIRIVAAAALAACSSAKSTEPRAGSAGSSASVPPDAVAVVADGPVASQGLVARFETPPGAMPAGDAKLSFVVENRGTTEATLDIDQLESAIFAIEVFDATGAQIYTVPPGVPPMNYQPRRESLAPGASRRFSVTLNVFSPELPAGNYTARLRPQSIQSETVRFAIR